jgi:hypothetical protein
MVKSSERAGPISVALALLAGSAIGNSYHSFIAGLAVAIGAFLLLVVGWEAVSWPLLRRQAAAAVDGSTVPPGRASEMATALHRERRLFKQLKLNLAGLDSKTLSNDPATRLVEAVLLTRATVGLSDLLKPTRDLSNARDLLRPAKELVDSKERRWSPVIGVGRTVFATIAAILDNREKLFAALDSCEDRPTAARASGQSDARVPDVDQTRCRRCGDEALHEADFRKRCGDAGLQVDAEGRVSLRLGGLAGGLTSVTQALGQQQADQQATFERIESRKGFQCSGCSAVYCMDCLFRFAPAHPAGGKACPSCGSKFQPFR